MIDIIQYIENESEYIKTLEDARRQGQEVDIDARSPENIEMTKTIQEMDDIQKEELYSVLEKRCHELLVLGNAEMNFGASFDKERIEYQKLLDLHRSIWLQIYVINNELTPLIEKPAFYLTLSEIRETRNGYKI